MLLCPPSCFRPSSQPTLAVHSGHGSFTNTQSRHTRASVLAYASQRGLRASIFARRTPLGQPCLLVVASTSASYARSMEVIRHSCNTERREAISRRHRCLARPRTESASPNTPISPRKARHRRLAEFGEGISRCHPVSYAMGKARTSTEDVLAYGCPRRNTSRRHGQASVAIHHYPWDSAHSLAASAPHPG